MRGVLQSGTPDIGALLQGILAAVVVVGILILYFERVVSLSHQIDSLTTSVSNISDDTSNIGGIDSSMEGMESDVSEMKDMTNIVHHEIKKTNFGKLDMFLDQEVSKNYDSGPPADNSVEYSFENLDITATISYVGNPDLHTALQDSPDGWSDEATVFNIEFDKQIETNSVAAMLSQDEDLIGLENELFDKESRIDPISPFTITCGLDSSDFDEIAEWITLALDKIEEYEQEVRRRSDGFDDSLKDHDPESFCEPKQPPGMEQSDN